MSDLSLRSWTITSSWTRHFVEHARHAGVETRELLRELGISKPSLDDPHGRVPFARHLELTERLLRRLDDPGAWIDVGAAAGAADFGIVGLLAESRPTLGGALEEVRRFNALANEASRMDFWVKGRRLYIQDAHLPDGRPVAGPLAEATLAFYASVIRGTTGIARPFEEVWFAHSRHGAWRPGRRDLFAAKMRFDQPINALVLRAPMLEAPMRSARPTLSPHLEELAERLHRELAPHEDPSLRVAREVRRRLGGGGPEPLDQIARSLGVATRTLQRQLKSSGLSYNDIVEEVRRELAASLLRSSELTLEAIAERVGYADLRSFRRAFARWTGQTPGAFRKASR